MNEVALKYTYFSTFSYDCLIRFSSFLILSKMINVQFKFEDVIKTVYFLVKTVKFQGQFDLEFQGHQFSNPSETFRCLINI